MSVTSIASSADPSPHTGRSRRLERAGLLRVAIHVGYKSQDRRRVRPVVPAASLGHPQQLPQRHGAGIDAGDGGKLVDDSPCFDSP